MHPIPISLYIHISVRYDAIEREAINQQSYLRIPSSLQNCRDKHTITNDTRVHPFHNAITTVFVVPFLTSNTFTTCLRWLMCRLYVCVCVCLNVHLSRNWADMKCRQHNRRTMAKAFILRQNYSNYSK